MRSPAWTAKSSSRWHAKTYVSPQRRQKPRASRSWSRRSIPSRTAPIYCTPRSRPWSSWSVSERRTCGFSTTSITCSGWKGTWSPTCASTSTTSGTSRSRILQAAESLGQARSTTPSSSENSKSSTTKVTSAWNTTRPRSRLRRASSGYRRSCAAGTCPYLTWDFREEQHGREDRFHRAWDHGPADGEEPDGGGLRAGPAQPQPGEGGGTGKGRKRDRLREPEGGG